MQLPEHAKKVFEGVIFDVFQWQQKMFDGSEETFERVRRPATVTVIPTAGSSVFISHEEQPGRPVSSTLLGGRVEEGEDPLLAAKRELLEEAGMASDDWELYKMYEPVIKIDWQIYVYIARNCRKVADQTLDAGERILVQELNFDAFVDLVSAEGFGETELAVDVLRMRLDGKLELFRKMLFT